MGILILNKGYLPGEVQKNGVECPNFWNLQFFKIRVYNFKFSFKLEYLGSLFGATPFWELAFFTTGIFFSISLLGATGHAFRSRLR